MNFLEAIEKLNNHNQNIKNNFMESISSDKTHSLNKSVYGLDNIKYRYTEAEYNTLNSKEITINNHLFNLKIQKDHISAHNWMSCKDSNGIGCEAHIVLGDAKTLNITLFRYPEKNRFPREREDHIIYKNYSEYIKDLLKSKEFALDNIRSAHENTDVILRKEQYNVKYLLCEVTLLKNIFNLIESNM